MSGLNVRQQRFADGVLAGMGQRAAYEAAGYKARGAAADVISCNMLKNTKIAAYIAKRRAKLADKYEITQERVLREYARIAFADERSFASWGPGGVLLRDSTQLTDDESAAVAEVSQTVTDAGGTIKFKLHDKKGALDSIAKILGLTVERHRHVILGRLGTMPSDELERLERMPDDELLKELGGADSD